MTDSQRLNGARLIDLDPEYRSLEGLGMCLQFDCPIGNHRISVPTDGRPLKNGARWTITNGDDFTKLSITPSINEEPCWHGWVTNGEVR
jgi:hypothetical protein